MVDAELVRALDYILNRSDAGSLDALAAAVVRRRRDLSFFGSANIPDPKKLAAALASGMNTGADLEGLRNSVRDMASSIIREHAPELSDGEIAELSRAWIPSREDRSESGEKLPGELLSSMVNQFVAFSQGSMGGLENRELREELGDWPKRYWKAFPQVVRLIVRAYLKGEISEEEYAMKLGTALAM